LSVPSKIARTFPADKKLPYLSIVHSAILISGSDKGVLLGVDGQALHIFLVPMKSLGYIATY
jgi:hypothetical protein